VLDKKRKTFSLFVAERAESEEEYGPWKFPLSPEIKNHDYLNFFRTNNNILLHIGGDSYFAVEGDSYGPVKITSPVKDLGWTESGPGYPVPVASTPRGLFAAWMKSGHWLGPNRPKKKDGTYPVEV
jgi:hypothetical protein